jgi:hypothetical protein
VLFQVETDYISEVAKTEKGVFKKKEDFSGEISGRRRSIPPDAT